MIARKLSVVVGLLAALGSGVASASMTQAQCAAANADDNSLWVSRGGGCPVVWNGDASGGTMTETCSGTGQWVNAQSWTCYFSGPYVPPFDASGAAAAAAAAQGFPGAAQAAAGAAAAAAYSSASAAGQSPTQAAAAAAAAGQKAAADYATSYAGNSPMKTAIEAGIGAAGLAAVAPAAIAFGAIGAAVAGAVALIGGGSAAVDGYTGLTPDTQAPVTAAAPPRLQVSISGASAPIAGVPDVAVSGGVFAPGAGSLAGGYNGTWAQAAGGGMTYTDPGTGTTAAIDASGKNLSITNPGSVGQSTDNWKILTVSNDAGQVVPAVVRTTSAPVSSTDSAGNPQTGTGAVTTVYGQDGVPLTAPVVTYAPTSGTPIATTSTLQGQSKTVADANPTATGLGTGSPGTAGSSGKGTTGSGTGSGNGSGVGGGTCGGAGQPACMVDFAQTGTLADPTARTGAQVKGLFDGAGLTALLAYTPSGAGQCPRTSFDVWGHSYDFGAFCDTLDSYNSQINTLARLGWLMLALAIVLSA